VVGTQDLFFASRIVGGSARVLDEAAPAGSAAVTLLAFRGVPVSNGVTAIAMAAIRGLGRFVFHHVPQCIPTTPVEPLPLPKALLVHPDGDQKRQISRAPAPVDLQIGGVQVQVGILLL